MGENRPRHMTLDRFLVGQQRAHPGAGGELTRVMDQVGTVGKIISSYMRRAALGAMTGLTGAVNVQGEKVQKLDELGNTIFVQAFEYVDIVGALVSEEMAEPLVVEPGRTSGKYVVLVDPIDGSSNLDVDCAVGSIFSIRGLEGSVEESILREGAHQVAAGYIMYGTSTVLVYTAGDGVHSFVLDEEIGEFVLDHENVRMPDQGKTMASNFGNYKIWGEPTRKFVDTLAAGDKELLPSLLGGARCRSPSGPSQGRHLLLPGGQYKTQGQAAAPVRVRTPCHDRRTGRGRGDHGEDEGYGHPARKRPPAHTLRYRQPVRDRRL